MFGFQYPAVLWGLPLLAGFLIWVYLRRGRGKQVLVSSVILLRGLTSPSSSRKRFVPPPRFFLELLFVIALLAALAGLFRQGKLKRYAVVIDNSFSMMALDPQNHVGLSLLSAAVQSATSLINSMESDSRIEVFVTSPQLSSLTRTFAEPDKARAVLGNVKPAYAEDNLQSIIDKLSLEETFERVFVFTDRSIAESTDATTVGFDKRFMLRSQLDSRQNNARSNAAITDLGWRQDFSADGRQDLTVTLKAFSASGVKGKITLSVVSAGTVPVNFSDIESREVSIKSGESEILVFGNLPPAAVAFRVLFEEHPSGGLDLIKEDNEAWISMEGGQERVVVVSDLPAEKLGLKTLRNLKFEDVKPEAYLRNPAGTRGQAVIFHRFVPPQLPRVNSLFVMPAGQNDWLKIGPEVSGVDITGWQSVHPLLSYLSLETLSIKSCRGFELPVWARELIASSVGPIAFSGELGGVKYMATGFELFPFEGKKSPLLSVFTLNILKWLTSLGSGSGYRLVNSALELARGVELPLFMDGSRLELSTTQTSGKESSIERRMVVLSRPGLVLAKSAENEVGFMAVNFFNDAESNLLRAQPVKLPLRRGAQLELTGKEDLTSRLCRLLLLLLFTDLAFILLRGALSGRARA